MDAVGLRVVIGDIVRDSSTGHNGAVACSTDDGSAGGYPRPASGGDPSESASGVGGLPVEGIDDNPSGSDGSTPLTNRGSVLAKSYPDSHSETVISHIDYLKVTVWGGVLEVREHLEWGFIDRWLAADFKAWEPLGCGGRLAAHWGACGVVSVLVYGENVLQGQQFVSVELKGEACGRVGDEGVADLLCSLAGRFRVRVSRVDNAWDYVGFEPDDAYRAAKRGDIHSERRMVHGRGLDQEWHQNAEGATFYNGRRRGPVFTRCYDRRGFVRFEIECKQGYAERMGVMMLQRPWEEWGGAFLELACSFCDYVDRGANEEGRRCPRLKWWGDFVGAAERRCPKPVVKEKLRYGNETAAKTEQFVMRNARMLTAISRAGLFPWLQTRAEFYGRRSWSATDDERVERIRKLRGSGLIGMPESDDEESPF